jgi:hypothetical protein
VLVKARSRKVGMTCQLHRGLIAHPAVPIGRQHGDHRTAAVLPNPLCPFSTAKVLALKATVLLLLTLLIKAKIRITAFSALGFALLLLQTLVFLALGGGLVVAVGGAALVASQQRRPAAA